jgi:hypothetical protein
MMARAWGALLSLAFVGAPASAAHDAHLTYTRLTVAGTGLTCRIRLFRDDLQRALRREPGQAGLVLSDAEHADSLFAHYAVSRLTLVADGVRLQGTVASSGVEHDVGGQEMVWFELAMVTAHPVWRLRIRNALLLDLFDNQQNLVSVVVQPGDHRSTLLFTPTDAKEQELTL